MGTGQKLEKYYGFKVTVAEIATPMGLKAVEQAVAEVDQAIINIEGYNPHEFKAYLHHFQVSRVTPRFGIKRLEDRLELVSMALKVNKKQRDARSIQFLNHVTTIDNIWIQRGVEVESSSFQIEHRVPCSVLLTHPIYNWYAITFVRNSVRRDYRKVTLEVTPHPTEDYRSKLAHEFGDPTRIRCRMRPNIQLAMPGFHDKVSPSTIPQETTSSSVPATNNRKTILRNIIKLVADAYSKQEMQTLVREIDNDLVNEINSNQSPNRLSEIIVEMLHRRGLLPQLESYMFKTRPHLQTNIKRAFHLL